MRRTIALLVALAVLAERAAVRSLPVRLLVLWILRKAETVAAAFVFEATGIPATAIDGIATIGNSAADARRLAARFKALAAALRALLPIAFKLESLPARRGFAVDPGARGSGYLLACWDRQPNDTS